MSKEKVSTTLKGLLEAEETTDMNKCVELIRKVLEDCDERRINITDVDTNVEGGLLDFEITMASNRSFKSDKHDQVVAASLNIVQDLKVDIVNFGFSREYETEEDEEDDDCQVVQGRGDLV